MTRPTTQPGLGTNDQAASADTTLSHNIEASQVNHENDLPHDMTLPTPPSTTIKPPPSPSIPQPLIATPDPFEEDLDNNPHSHFLSPVHMYESWDDSDSDSDDDGSYELDAGITDFALFTDDYNRAKEHDLPLSSKWDDFVASQEQCLDRAVARSRAEAEAEPRPAGPSPFYSGDTAVPSLTPDTSPKLVDDLDYDDSESDEKPYRTQIVVPDPPPSSSAPIPIPQLKITPADSGSDSSAIDESSFDDDATTPAFLLYRQRQRAEKRRKDLERPSQQSQAQLPPVRPGLSAGSRTLSGKLHVWRRPGWGLWSVEEEVGEGDVGEVGNGGEQELEQGGLRRKRGRRELKG